MTTDDALKRLQSGLDRDERIARAAIDSLRRSDMAPTFRYEGDVGTWIAESQKQGAGVRSVDGEIREDGEPESWRGPRQVIFSGDGEPTSEVAEHVARQDPKATLDRAEAIRLVLEKVGLVLHWHSDANVHLAAEDIIEALSAVYAEEKS